MVRPSLVVPSGAVAAVVLATSWIGACSSSDSSANADGGGVVASGYGGVTSGGGTSNNSIGGQSGAAGAHGGIAGASAGGSPITAGGFPNGPHGGSAGVANGGALNTAGMSGMSGMSSAGANAGTSAGQAGVANVGGAPGAGGASAGGAMSSGGSPAVWTPFVAPADCSVHGRILSYNPVGDTHLSAAFAANPSACADYYIHLPALADDKTMPRGADAVTRVDGYGNQFHAMAEFAWGAWSADTTSASWTAKAASFRQHMIDAGYDLTRDAWVINEVPSTWKTDPTVKANLRDVVATLSAAPSGGSAVLGAVFIIGIGSDTVNYSQYKPPLETWLTEADFWTAMRGNVRWWAQEVYASPSNICVASANVGLRSQHLNAFGMHPAILASAGPASVAEARLFFDDAYTPAMNAFWHGDSYDTNTLTLLQMENFVSTEIYSARSWAMSNTYPDGRVALSWNDQLSNGATDDDLTQLAGRIASSIHDAYAEGTPMASYACSPSGAFTWCQCEVTGAAFNESWSAFSTWLV